MLQWIPPVAIALIFILQLFFSWVGVFPGNLPAITQNAWYAAFGFYSEADDMAKFVEVQPGVSSKTEADAAKKPAETARRDQPEVVLDRPSISLLLIFYLVPFFLVTLAATVLVAVLPYVQLSLPPAVQQLLPWKWVILTALNAVLVLFLVLQMLTYFGIESSYAASIEARFAPAKAANGEGKPERKLTTTEKNQLAVERGKYLQWLQRTTTLYVVLLLHVLSLVSCALIYWIEKRGSAKPLPRLEIRY